MVWLKLKSKVALQCCEKVSAPFLISLIFACNMQFFQVTFMRRQQTTRRTIISKQRNLRTAVNCSRSGQPTKIPPTVHRLLIQEATKECRQTFKEPEALLTSAKVSFHNSSIRKRLGKNSTHGRAPRRKPLLIKTNIKAPYHTCQKTPRWSP